MFPTGGVIPNWLTIWLGLNPKADLWRYLKCEMPCQLLWALSWLLQILRMQRTRILILIPTIIIATAIMSIIIPLLRYSIILFIPSLHLFWRSITSIILLIPWFQFVLSFYAISHNFIILFHSVHSIILLTPSFHHSIYFCTFHHFIHLITRDHSVYFIIRSIPSLNI